MKLCQITDFMELEKNPNKFYSSKDLSSIAQK